MPAAGHRRHAVLLGLVHDDRLGGQDTAAIDAAFCTADGTLAASMTPALKRSSYSPVAALRPSAPLRSGPARLPRRPRGRRDDDLLQRLLERPGPRCGHRRLVTFQLLGPIATHLWARSRATPPPGPTPSSTAALVVDTASSILCFFSLSSTSVAAPTLMTATPPDSLARRPGASPGRSRSRCCRSRS